jgi:hypothetical protein
MRSISFDNNENENRAAAEMLNTPEMAVVNSMETSVELIWRPEIATRLQLNHIRRF